MALPSPTDTPEERRSRAGTQRRASWIKRSRAGGSWSHVGHEDLVKKTSILVVPGVHRKRHLADHGDIGGRLSPIEYVLQTRSLTQEGYRQLSGPGRLSPDDCSRTPFGPQGAPFAPQGAPLGGEWQSVLQDAQEDARDQAAGAARRSSYEEAERKAGREPDAEVAARLQAGLDLYPNCHVHIWLRSCRQEVVQPLTGTVTGDIPRWIRGTLIRNGPGSLECGEDRFQHLFDGAALLQRFCISEGRVTYQCRFLRSQTWRRNAAAKRIVVTEFGTRAAPDPCQSIFKRVAAMFNPGEVMSDNAMISVYPIGDEFYAFTESPVMTRVDPVSLDTLARVNMASILGIVNHSSHPLVLEDGSVVNLGMSLSATGPQYSLIHFPAPQPQPGAGSAVECARLHGSVPARWPLHPGYMHSFGGTASFWVLVEQPLSVSVPAMVRGQLSGEPMAGSLRWFPEHPTLIHLVSRETGKRTHTFEADAFFFLHVINCYERPSLAAENSTAEPGEVVVDICCYKDPAMISCMYIDSLKEAQQNPDYARLFRGRPLRFVLPLRAAQVARGLRIEPRVLCDLGCETPRLNQHRVSKPYRYFYAISSDVDADNPGTLIKVDTWSSSCRTWGQPGLYPSEPIFIPSPDAKFEDDGVVLCALVWGGDDRRAGMLVVDAASMEEIGRAEFRTPSQVPKCLHGWFAANVSSEKD